MDGKGPAGSAPGGARLNYIHPNAGDNKFSASGDGSRTSRHFGHVELLQQTGHALPKSQDV